MQDVKLECAQNRKQVAMKLATYSANGSSTYGSFKEGGFVALGRHLRAYPDLLTLIAGGGLEEAKTITQSVPADVGADEVTWQPVIPNPPKIFCVGVNYKAHAEEGGHTKVERPFIFPRYAETQVGHLQPMVCPRESDKFDYEGELVAIIGKGGRRIPAKNALEYVAGYSIYNEGSVRDWQLHSTQWTPGKNFFATGSFGPWMVTADEIDSPHGLELTTRLNGQVMQKASTSLMIFPLDYLISYISTFIPLSPGDVIVSGTPGGVGHGRMPPCYMKEGDSVEVEISMIGTLCNPVESEH